MLPRWEGANNTIARTHHVIHNSLSNINTSHYLAGSRKESSFFSLLSVVLIVGQHVAAVHYWVSSLHRSCKEIG